VSGPILEFGDFRLDCDRSELSRAGRILKLERKPLELLILLATREGNVVNRAEIAQRLWGSDVFVDTEHGINTAVRKVRHALRDDPNQPRFVQTVTGRGYRFVGPVVAIPSTEVPVNGDLSAKPSEGPPATQPPTSSRHTLRLILGSIAVLALVAILVMQRRREHRIHAATLNIHSLAVLPLENLSGNPKQDYFAAGMSDELTTMLAKDSSLRIISRTSAKQVRAPQRPLPQIAASLGVDGIVEGSISRAGGKVHMTVQLIHAPTDTHLWADSYDRNNDDVAALPEEAAQAIAKRLNASVAAARPARYINPAAHDAYLQGKFHFFTSTDGGGAYFNKAVEIQPDYAAGWAGLAQYYGTSSGTTLDPRQANGPFMFAARKAVELDDSLAESHEALGAALFYTQWDWAGAEREIKRAIELDPEYSEAHHRYAEMLAVLNRYQEAIAQQRIATELDPFERPRSMAYLYELARQYDAALADLKQRLATKPDDDGLLLTLADVYRCKGMYKESVDATAQLLTVRNQQTEAREIRSQYARGGYEAVLRAQIARLEKMSRTQYVSSFALAQSYGQLKQRGNTLDLLEQAFRMRDPNLLNVQCDPTFDFLHTDQRYRALIKKIGLPPAW
jgi:TolB-like protein/DNA-binding winged helix-turn-helix (wHTH) protein